MNITDCATQWKPLVTETAIKKEIENKILEIAEAVKENYKLYGRVGFLRGNAGVLGFMYYTNLYFKSNIFDKEVDECFSEIIQSLTVKKNNNTSFCDGLAGFLWSMDLFNQIGFIDSSSDGSLGEVIVELQNDLALHIEKGGNFDYLYGSCIFLSEELIKFDNSVIIDCLIRKAITTASGAMKIPFLENAKGERQVIYDYGIAHGTAGVIGCLSANYQRTQKKEVKIIIEKLIDFYFESTNNTGKGHSVWPNVIKDENKISYTTRLAWCYGDLGASMVIYLAGKRIGNETIVKKAINILKDCANRRDFHTTLFSDAGMCHGTAGVAHIFNRIYQYTEEQIFAEAALHWIKDTLKRSDSPEGFAGYRIKYGNDWVNSVDVISGVSGIGLALIASISNEEPKWDKSFLLS
jgi:lantibiotic modifying enzyme